MRISDWSSDVCSSDLGGDEVPPGALAGLLRRPRWRARAHVHYVDVVGVDDLLQPRDVAVHHDGILGSGRQLQVQGAGAAQVVLHRPALGGHDGGAAVGNDGSRDLDGRSEEHTSELQSLMRISYAVFCLKKKTKIEDER